MMVRRTLWAFLLVWLAGSAGAEPLTLERTLPLPEGANRMGRVAALTDETVLFTAFAQGDSHFGRGTSLFAMPVPTSDAPRRLGVDRLNWQNYRLRQIHIGRGHALLCDADRDTPGGPERSLLIDAATGARLVTFENPGDQGRKSPRFARSCALDNDTAAITTSWRGGDAGKREAQLLLYDTASGALRQTIDLPQTYGPVIFRRGLAMDARFIAVGTMGADWSTGYFGRVDLYDRQTGAHLKTFHRPDNGIRHNNGAFGYNILLNGDDLVVAAIYDSEKGREGGTVWIYDIPSGQIKQRFTSPLERKNSEFGISMTLWRGHLLIGQPDARVADMREAGAVWVFEYETGALVQGLLGPSPDANTRFGEQIAATGQRVMVTAARHHQPDLDGRAVYLFRGEAQ